MHKQIGALAPSEQQVTLELHDGRTLRFTLRRPGRRGLANIQLRIADTYGRVMAPGLLQQNDGTGIEMDAVLAEYLAEAPAEYVQADAKTETKRPVLKEDMPVEIYVALGEAAPPVGLVPFCACPESP